MLPSTNVVPSGILSFTVATPSTSPVFLISIVYVNVSPFSTSCLSTFFSNVITGTFVSFVSSPFTVALFAMSPVTPVFIVTLKLKLAVPPFFATSISIPVDKSAAVFSVASPFILILPSTNVVPSGISSFTTAIPSNFPEFSIAIVYVSSSPTLTDSLSGTFSEFIIGL